MNTYYSIRKSAVTYADEGIQTFNRWLIKGFDIKNNPGIFQRICQVAAIAIMALSDYVGKPILEKFKPFLASTSDGHLFWSILKRPYQWFYPIAVAHIDWDQLCNHLTSSICITMPYLNQAKANEFARNCVTAQLQYMLEKDVRYKVVQDFKIHLAYHILLEKQKNPFFRDIAIEQITIPCKSASRMKSASTMFFTGVDVFRLAFFLDIVKINLVEIFTTLISNGAELIGMGGQAKALGQTRLFQFAANSELSDWIWGGSAIAYMLLAIDSVTKQKDVSSKEWERKNAKWSALMAISEAVYCTLQALRWENPLLYPLGLLTKGLGIFALSKKEKPQLLPLANR